jgi:hypothetical protein
MVDITSEMVCAKGTNSAGKVVDACLGDSGGPMVRKDNEAGFLYGVVSFGIGCATDDFSGVYTRTSRFLGWIYDTTLGAGSAIVSDTTENQFCEERAAGFDNGSDDDSDDTGATDNSKSCGLPHSLKIFGGIDAKASDYPWFYTIQKCDADYMCDYSCPATLISGNFLLTSADCTGFDNGNDKYDPAAFILISKIVDNMASIDLTLSDQQNLHILTVNSDTIQTHPDHSVSSFLENNLAVIKFEPFTGRDIPICVPSSDVCFTSPKTLKTVGYNNGRFPELKSLEIPLIKQSTCKSLFNSMGHTLVLPCHVTCTPASGNFILCTVRFGAKCRNF